jgi:hypothetical protein
MVSVTTLLLLAVVSLLVILIVAVCVHWSTPADGRSRSVALSRTGAQDAMRRAAEAPYRPRARWGIQVTIVREERDE